MTRKHHPINRNPVVRAIIFVFGLFARYYFAFKVEGKENIPECGPYILVTNHVTTLDIGFGALLPLNGEAVFLAKREAFGEGILGPLLRSAGTIPIDRDIVDASAAKVMLRTLRQGKIVALAPEGTRTRNGQVQEFKPGFVKLALLARVPILPVAIVGSFGILPTPYHFPRRARVRVRVGPAIDLREYYGKKLSENEIERISGMVRGKIIDLYNGNSLPH